MIQHKKITIIIVTYNARHYMPECLDSVFHSRYPQDLLQVIVIDNNSADSTVGYIKEKYPQVRLIVNKDNTGFAKANNQGFFLAQKSACDYAVLLNQDTIVEPNWLEHMVEVAESDKKIAIVQPKLLLHPEKHLINSFGNSIHYLGFAFCNHYREPDNKKNEIFELPYASGAACLLKMSAIEKMKDWDLFDERLFMYHEDVDLGWRTRLAGFKVVLDPFAVVYHKYNFGKAKYKFYYMERNRHIVMLENYKWRTLLLLSPILLVVELGMFVYALKNGWFKEKLAGDMWVLSRLGSILKRRNMVQRKLRKVTDKEIIRLYVGSIKFQDLQYFLITYVANPIMEIYLKLVQKIISW